MPSGVVHNLADVKNIIFFIKIKLFRRLFNELMVGLFCTFFYQRWQSTGKSARKQDYFLIIKTKLASDARALFYYIRSKLVNKLTYQVIPTEVLITARQT